MATLADYVINIELREVGYKEEPDGWTKYGKWFADNIAHDPGFARGDWCVMFQTWAMIQAGVPDWPRTSPQGSEVNALMEWLDARGYRTSADDMPQPGDIVFYSWHADADDIDHVGLIVDVSGAGPDDAVIEVIEGNYSDEVGIRYTYYRDRFVARTYRLPCMADVKFPPLSFMLRRGSEGEAVELLQAALIYRGYDIYGGVDGVFGSHTENALKRYQDDVGIEVDGKAGTETFSHLMAGDYYG